MSVRAELLKHTGNEMLERTTGKQDSDFNQRHKEPSVLLKAMINKRFQYVESLFTEGFQFSL